MSQVKVVGQRGRVNAVPLYEPRPVNYAGSFRTMGIVSSTGGPNALAQLLNALGPRFPLPILLVQHISGAFVTGFAAWLKSVCPFPVKIVEDRVDLAPGVVYLAAPDRHLRLGLHSVETDAGDPVSQQRPSGTVLFESMARALGRQALGVVLTGMGNDGAHGLLRVRQRGGYTIAEDESTAVVYGMPAEAVRLGGVCESLPLPAIGPRIRELVAKQERPGDRPCVLSPKAPQDPKCREV